MMSSDLVSYFNSLGSSLNSCPDLGDREPLISQTGYRDCTVWSDTTDERIGSGRE
jgi:hypothetical protein